MQSIQYIGMLLDDKLYWQEHVNQTCVSLIKYFGICNHIDDLCIGKDIEATFLHLYIREFNMA